MKNGLRRVFCRSVLLFGIPHLRIAAAWHFSFFIFISHLGTFSHFSLLISHLQTAAAWHFSFFIFISHFSLLISHLKSI